MSDQQVRDIAIVLLVAMAPFTIVLLAAIVRGYSVHLTFTRDRHDSKRDS